MEESESLSRYFKEIKEIDLLSEEEEILLFEKIRLGDLSAREKLIRSNLLFVVRAARKFKVKGLLLEDLINEGNMGLSHAVEKFDLKKNFRFITYADYWIKKFIQKFIDTKGSNIHLPQKKAELLRKSKKTRDDLENRLEREAYCDEIAEYLNIPEETVRELWDYLESEKSFDAPVKWENDEELFLHDILADSGSKSIEELLNTEEGKRRISNLLPELTQKERMVLELHFGIDMESSFNLKEISQRLNISPERARQLKEAGLKRLKDIFKIE
jgi:RNA polymerase primary sigma factor